MNLDSRKKVFDAGIFHSFDEFLVFLSGDELYEHRNIYFKCGNTIFPEIHKTLLGMEGKDCFHIEAAKEEGFTGYFLLTGVSRSALEKADTQSWPSTTQKEKRSLKDDGLDFDESRSYLIGKSGKMKIRPNTKENAFYTFMFRQKTEALVDWSLFMESYTGDDDYREEHGDKKMVRDLIDRINLKVQQKFKTKDKLFSFEKDCIRRHF